tara:strand:- start:4767 stop:4949 length:183 start_codon:yes stop_codon:yes gene_type:complete
VSRRAAHRGRLCPHRDGETEEQDCNTQICPVDCVGSWSDCNAQCVKTYNVTTRAAGGGEK